MRKGSNPPDLGEFNQALARIQATLPQLMKDLGEEAQGTLVVALHTFSTWMRRIESLSPADLPPAQLHLKRVTDAIFKALRAEELGPQLRVRLAALGRVLLLLRRS